MITLKVISAAVRMYFMCCTVSQLHDMFATASFLVFVGKSCVRCLQMVLIETVVTGFVDEFPRLGLNKWIRFLTTLTVCVTFFLAGISMTTQVRGGAAFWQHTVCLQWFAFIDKKAKLTLRQARDSTACMKTTSEEIYGKSTQEHNVEKYIQWVTTLYSWRYGSIFIRLAVVASQICEMPRNSPKILTYSSSRSSKVIDLGANRKCICNFLLGINEQ